MTTPPHPAPPRADAYLTVGYRRAAGALLTVGIGLVVGALLTVGYGLTPAGAAESGDEVAAARAVVRGTQPARAPFETLTAGTVRVGGRRVDVVVADSLKERTQGLRGRPDASPYAGMLFVFPEDTRVAFTMAGVPDALDITFFDRRGRRVDQRRMLPCAGTDATCPVYLAAGPYRYSLETAPGEMPAGRLRVAGAGRAG